MVGYSPWGRKELDTTERLHFLSFYSSFWRRKWQPTPVFLSGESHGRRGLVGYSLWGCKESDTTEQHTLTHTHTHRSLKSRCQQGHASSATCKGESSPDSPWFLVFMGDPWHFLACRHIAPISASVVTWPSSPHVSCDLPSVHVLYPNLFILKRHQSYCFRALSNDLL